MRQFYCYCINCDISHVLDKFDCSINCANCGEPFSDRLTIYFD